MPLEPGQKLTDRYRIDALLGQGGMGAVYRGTDLRFNAPVAIKENHLGTPESQRQFSREAHLLFQLRHPNLPRVTDHFTIPNQGQYLIMDYIDGPDLNQILERHGPIPQGQALEWMAQVFDALAYLHSQEPEPVIHRDVKPANIKVTPEGRVYLVDFGLAKVFDPEVKTTFGARGATPGFAPPEQYGYGRTDARTDIYSAAATLYALLTGQRPADAQECLLGQARLIPPRELEPTIRPNVEAAILRAMQARPESRYPTVADLRTALTAGPGQTTLPLSGERLPDAGRPRIPAAPDKPETPPPQERSQRLPPAADRSFTAWLRTVPLWLRLLLASATALLLVVVVGVALVIPRTKDGPAEATTVTTATVATWLTPTATVEPSPTVKPPAATTETPTRALTPTGTTTTPAVTPAQVTSTLAPIAAAPVSPMVTYVPATDTATRPTNTPRTPDVPTSVPPSSTPSPRPTFAAPDLLEPVAGATFSGCQSDFAFAWSGLGQLAQDEYYVLTIEHALGIDEVWTKTTRWRIQAQDPFIGKSHGYLCQLNPTRWYVVVKQRTATKSDGQPEGRVRGVASEKRSFSWRPFAQPTEQPATEAPEEPTPFPTEEPTEQHPTQEPYPMRMPPTAHGQAAGIGVVMLLGLLGCLLSRQESRQ
jgi:serine/threonine protein kinase